MAPTCRVLSKTLVLSCANNPSVTAVALCQVPRRWNSSLESSRLQTTPCGPSQLQTKPPVDKLAFGKYFTDHLLRIRWTADEGWDAPRILPFHNFSMHPGAKVLHYAQELFEGMKAYRGVDDRIRMFRPMHNMARMNVTAQRACLPTFDGHELVECIRKLVQIDQEWVPHCTSSSLYIRPTLIGTEPTLGVAPADEAELFVLLCPVGPYFSTGIKPVNLLADPRYVRAWPGGCGFAKMGSNYAPTLWTQQVAAKHNCHQCLWLFGEDHEITEVGAMNVFVFLETENGEKELVTPPLTGIILPGVTRRSIIELTSEWDEFKVTERKITMKEVMKAKDEGRLIEMFGAGTAAIVSPIGGIFFNKEMQSIPVPDNSLAQRIMASMTDIYYGRVNHPWAIEIENWQIDRDQEIKDYKDAEPSGEATEGIEA